MNIQENYLLYKWTWYTNWKLHIISSLEKFIMAKKKSEVQISKIAWSIILCIQKDNRNSFILENRKEW